MKINVTKQDIVNGKRSNNCYCPIALAIKRAMINELRTISVNYRDVWYSTDKNIVYHSLPDEAMKFILAYDNEQPVKPFSFTLKGKKHFQC